MSGWSTPADVEAKLRRRWNSGALLRAYALDEPFDTLDVPLRGPTAAELADRFDEARRWAAALERASEGGRRFSIVPRSVGGRHLGRTEVPGRAVIDSYEQAWRVLGVRQRNVASAGRGDVDIFTDVLDASRLVPSAREWALAHPIKAIQIADEWSAILAARDWLEWNRGSGLYLRQVDAPGVDTKLVERHRGLLAEMLAVSGTAAGFTSDLGFAAKPGRVRLRFDPVLLGMPAAVTEGEFRIDEIGALEPAVERVLIVENEITHLSVPVPPSGMVVYGRGYEVAAAASLSWLADAAANGRVFYWGDLDTHGFAILDRVRAHLPNVRSFLMDRRTLLEHEARWGHEPAPTNAMLPRLTDAEAALYADFVSERYAPALRLEQERIDWSWAEREIRAL